MPLTKQLTVNLLKYPSICPAFALLGSLAIADCVPGSGAEMESELKFTLYSAAWSGNTQDRLRLVAHNTTEKDLRLDSITFLKQQLPKAGVELTPGLKVPALGYADLDIEYVDLLQDNDCIRRTLTENWRLAEISNYTLNPSVRNLIIEDTETFRIYQCTESVRIRWTSLDNQQSHSRKEWVLFHFEHRNGQ